MIFPKNHQNAISFRDEDKTCGQIGFKRENDNCGSAKLTWVTECNSKKNEKIKCFKTYTGVFASPVSFFEYQTLFFEQYALYGEHRPCSCMFFSVRHSTAESRRGWCTASKFGASNPCSSYRIADRAGGSNSPALQPVCRCMESERRRTLVRPAVISCWITNFTVARASSCFCLYRNLHARVVWWN